MSTPEIKVVKGNPTEDELAALRTVGADECKALGCYRRAQ